MPWMELYDVWSTLQQEEKDYINMNSSKEEENNNSIRNTAQQHSTAALSALTIPYLLLQPHLLLYIQNEAHCHFYSLRLGSGFASGRRRRQEAAHVR